MKPACVVEVYTTKFSHSLFYWKFRKTWFLLKKNVSQWIPKISESKTFVLSYFKVKNNPDCSNKEYNVVFKHFYHNITVFPKSKKKSALINEWKIVAYREESEQSEALANKFGLSQI